MDRPPLSLQLPVHTDPAYRLDDMKVYASDEVGDSPDSIRGQEGSGEGRSKRSAKSKRKRGRKTTGNKRGKYALGSSEL